MISAESRKDEEEVAARLYFEQVHHGVSHVNETLKLDQKYMSLLHRWRAYAISQKNADMTAFITEIDSKNIPSQEQRSRELVNMGEKLIAQLKENQAKTWPASRLKLRTQWLASLVSSGAVPEWQVRLCGAIPTSILA